ncbi:MAG: glyoxylate/hydroxypyruvate reductase A, partial [Pseudomonadota bacterium]
WEFDHDLFDRMPDLEVIFSAGAGVDKVLANPALPEGIPIVRFVDPTLTTRMGEWICLQCLMHLRQQLQYEASQKASNWNGLPQPQASEISIGIMGMGVLGQDAANKLKMLGFQVSGWSRSKKQIDGIDCYDATETDAFLARNNYLIGLLPHTPETQGIFNRSLFQKLKKHPVLPSPVFINAGRGKSQVETDIVACLNDGTLGGVSLDVFETEPLDPESPLWGFENAILTPHVASDSDVVALGRYVDERIEKYEAGGGLDNLVDREAGY